MACEHNGCVEALSSMRRDAEVAPKCLLISLVIRKRKGIVWKGRLRPKKEEEEEEKGEKGGKRNSDHGGLHHPLIITEQCP